jgi:alpha-soluble NSF attachment protein
MLTGIEYQKKAEKYENKWFNKDYDEIYELYANAGKTFRYEKNINSAIKMFLKAGNIASRLKNISYACESYVECVHLYKKINDYEKSENFLEVICNLYISNNQITYAAKLLMSFADDLIELKKYEEAIPKYKLALQYFDTEDIKQSLLTCKIKLADAYTKIDKFNDAFGLYENISLSCMGCVLKFQAKQYNFLAFLCKLALVENNKKMENMSMCSEILESYIELNPDLKYTLELEICENLIQSLESDDEEILDICLEISQNSTIKILNIPLFEKVIVLLRHQINNLR